MRFGSSFHIQKDLKSGVTKTTVKKVRDYNEYVNETIVEERVQIMKIQDFFTIVEQMAIEHALQDYGAWLEHGKDNKMYVIKSWIIRE